MNIFTDNFQATPYWWERTPRPDFGDNVLPKTADVVIIGSGYTGLSAAIQTARHGRATVVLDAEDAGWGCSTRNGGQVSTSLKPTFSLLAKKFGTDAALKILREGNNALAWIEQFIREQNIDCDFQKVGRFHGAHTPGDFQKLTQKISEIPDELNINARIVSTNEQPDEIASDFYHGGVVYPNHASLDPGKYHQGLLNCARTEDAQIVTHCRVNAIKKVQHKVHATKPLKQKLPNQKQRGMFQITTSKGIIIAADVIIATSGYTGRATPWLRRRIIPIGSYMIATEPLPQTTIAKLLPNNRVITDTRKLVIYYRACPQQRRILFGGRVSIRETNLRTSAALLRQQMLNIFPQLKAARITHSWMGWVGYTFDETPHNGIHDGMHYALGYCGSGISLSSYFGMKTGLRVVANSGGRLRIAGDSHTTTALDPLPFPSRPWYHGNPWFLAPAMFYYQWRDRRRSR